MRAVLFVIRLVMVIVWSFVFYLAAYLALQYAYIGPLVRAAQPNNPGAVRAAMRSYTVPIFGGSVVLAVALKLLGVLPGAVRRQSRAASPVVPTAPAQPPVGANEPLAPGQRADFLEAVIPRLAARGFTASTDLGASGRYEYANLPPGYLYVGKRLRYSRLSIIGAIEEVVLLAGAGHVDEPTIRLLAGRAVVDARARRSRFHGALPVVQQFVFPVIVADAVALGLADHFRTHPPPSDRVVIVFPVVYDRATGEVVFYRKIPLFNNVGVQLCLRRAEELFGAVSRENAASQGFRSLLDRWS